MARSDWRAMLCPCEESCDADPPSLRKPLPADSNAHRLLDRWAVPLAAICFTLALAEGIALTPAAYREGLFAAVYEAMLQSP